MSQEEADTDTALALLGVLSDNYLKHAQNNTVVLTHEKVDRVGFELTTCGSIIKSKL